MPFTEITKETVTFQIPSKKVSLKGRNYKLTRPYTKLRFK